MTALRLILASTSLPRQELLTRLKIPFEIVGPHIDETPLAHETPEQLVLRLAKQKAQAIAERFPESIIIGADQVGVLENKILCKPLTHENAVEQLQQVSDKCVRYRMGLCVFNTKTNTEDCLLETIEVFFRPLSRTMIETYLKKENVLHCAGSLKIEGLGIALVKEVKGDINALMGLPLIPLITILEKNGLNILKN